MALSLQTFITNAEAGVALKIKAKEDIINVSVGGIDIRLGTTYYDLGRFHTAKMVLDSYTLRQAIANGSAEAEVGTIGLSKEPVV